MKEKDDDEGSMMKGKTNMIRLEFTDNFCYYYCFAYLLLLLLLILFL